MVPLLALVAFLAFISRVSSQATLSGNTKCAGPPQYEEDGAWPNWGLGHVGCWTGCPQGVVQNRELWEHDQCRAHNRERISVVPAWKLPKRFDANNPPQCKRSLDANAANCGECRIGTRAYCGPVTTNPVKFPIEPTNADYSTGACSDGVGALGMGRMEECDGFGGTFGGGFCRIEPLTSWGNNAPAGSNLNVHGPVPPAGGAAPYWGPKQCPPGTVEYGKLPCPLPRRGTAPRANRLCRITAHQLRRNARDGHFFVVATANAPPMEYDRDYNLVRDHSIPVVAVGTVNTNGGRQHTARAAYYDDEMLYEEAWDNLERANDEFEIAKQLLRRNRLRQESGKNKYHQPMIGERMF